MEQGMVDILIELAKIAPVIAVLIIGLKHFIKKVSEKETEIKELQQQLRESEKESLESMLKVLSFLEKAEDKDSAQHTEILNKIEQMRLELSSKLDALK